MYDHGICYCFLANHGHLVFVDIFYNKLTLVIFYYVVGTYDDCEPSFVRADEKL